MSPLTPSARIDREVVVELPMVESGGVKLASLIGHGSRDKTEHCTRGI